MHDRIFDGLAQRFQKRIYGGLKGELRLYIMQDDLQTYLDHLPTEKSLRVLDAGGGLGQMAIWFAERGHQVLLCDPSQDMLRLAASAIQERSQQQAEIADNIELLCCSVQDLAKHTDESFDLVLFHAVLEWLAEPKATLQILLDFIKPSGGLSLMFYNRHSAVLRNLLMGNFACVIKDKLGAQGHYGLTPLQPLDPDEVRRWLETWELKLLQNTGVRVLSDYMQAGAKERVKQADLFHLERQLSRQEPYRSMARYRHFLLQNSRL